MDKQVKKKKKKGNKLRIFIIILIALAILGALFAKRVYDLNGNWLAALMGHNQKTLENLDKLTVLVMGESTGLTDTILVCSYDPKTQKASMLSIPRDTFTGENTYNARASHKINSLYLNGTTPEKTLEAVNNITGLEVDKYVVLDTTALKELVDIIGGLEFDVPIDMKYDDNKQKLHINLKAGKQKLNGEQVEGLVRFRHNNNGSTYPYDYGIEDYGRMRTQRNVIKAIVSQTIKLKNVTEIGKIFELLEKYVDTNMDVNSLKDYIPYAININMDEIQNKQLPGESKVLNGMWFFLHDEEKTKTLVDKMFNAISEETNNNQNTDAENSDAE